MNDTRFDFARSTSQRRTYRACPKKFFLQYGLRWRAHQRRATYLFGIAVQSAVNVMLENASPLTPSHSVTADEWFAWLWAGTATVDPDRMYWGKWDQKKLLERGIKLLLAIEDELLAEFDLTVPLTPDGKPFLIEPKITYVVGGVREMVIPDLAVRRKSGAIAVIDFKTSDREYDETAAEIDEQLTSEQLGIESLGLSVDYVALCVLVYQERNPRLQWLWQPARDAEAVAEFTASVQVTDELIRRGVFYRDERSCHVMGACDFIPLCYRSCAAKITTDLYQEPPRKGDVAREDAALLEGF